MTDRPTQQDVLLAILALDAYSRGANPQLRYSADEADVLDTSIGTATWKGHSDALPGATTVGFSASWYEIDGKKVISYRGTDFDFSSVSGVLNFINDVVYGWFTSFGATGDEILLDDTQVKLAQDFYKQVTGREVFPPAGSGPVSQSDVLITGHSLGGSLAGFTASLTRSEAVVFNEIPFLGSAFAVAYTKYINGLGLSTYQGNPLSALIDFFRLAQKMASGEVQQIDFVVPDASSVTSFRTEWEVAAAARLLGPWLGFGSTLAIDKILGPLAPILSPLGTGLSAEVAGLAFGAAQAADAQQTIVSLASHGGLRNPISLHSQALMVMLTYARSQNHEDWQKVGPALLDALYNDDVAKAAGTTGLGGYAGDAARLMSAVAYSAVPEGSATVFGDAAIRALFDDADQLGKIAGAEAATFLKSDPVKAALAEIAVQFAGDLALSKVLRENAPWAETGTFELLQSNRVLVADLDPEKWRATFNKDTASGEPKTGQEKIVGVETLLASLLKLETEGGRGAEFLGSPDRKLTPDIIEAINAWKAAAAPAGGGAAATLSPSQRVTLLAAGADGQRVDLDAVALARQTLGKDGEPRTAVPLAHDGEAGGAVLIGTAMNDGLAGDTGSDLLIAGAGDDTVFRTDGGKAFDLYFLDDGNDTYKFRLIQKSPSEAGPSLRSPKGEARIFGGLDQGKDTFDYSSSDKALYFETVREGEGIGAYRVTYLEDKGKADDQAVFVDKLFSFNAKMGSNFGDEFNVTQPVKTILEELKELGSDLLTFLGFGGQAPQEPAPGSGGNGAGGTSGDANDIGDVINLSGGGTAASTDSNGKKTPPKGIVIDLRDDEKQFLADAKGALPTRLGLEGKFPVNGLVQQLQFYNLVRDELTEPTDRSGYQSNERLNLKNAESVFGTSYNDLIIGADVVYTWKLPDPPPPSEDPNAPPPPPMPQKVVDKDFAGYDLIGGAGDDTILIYNGNKDQVTFHKVDGGDGKDVIAIKTDGKTQYKGPLTGAVTNSTIDGGAKDDAIFVFGGGEGLQVFGGQGRDFIYVKPNASPEKMPFVEVYGDTIDGRKEEPVVDGNGNPVLDDKGNPLTQSESVEDTKENADLFWFAHGVAIKDAQHHDILAFYGMPLTGGNIAAGGAFAVAATSIGGYTGGGLAWAGFQTTIAANTNYEGKKPGWTGGLFWDNLVPFINYVFDINTHSLYVTNYVDALSSLIIGHDQGMFDGTREADDPNTPEDETTNLTGFMRIDNFDLVATLLGALQQQSTSSSFGGNGYENYQGTLNMVFKQINPVSVILDMLPPTAITFGIQAKYGGSPLIDAAAARNSKGFGDRRRDMRQRITHSRQPRQPVAVRPRIAA